ncbi:MAG: protein kinase [Planctomycetota bacterium]
MADLPEKLGPYLIESELGRGGMGVVYLARDPSLNRRVAIKVLGEEVSEHPDRLARFVREARTLASLEHTNLAQVFGLHDHLGQKLLVMEYVPGRHLGQRLREDPALSVSEGIAIGAQIAAALEVAHNSGVIHRDMKPANVRVRPDGTVKVLDFGLAKPEAEAKEPEADDETVSFALTEAGRVLGTAGYMSPEQARGKPVDKRTDIWAFGCVLFESLAGERAFPGETPMDAIVAVMEKQPAWHALPPETPTRIIEVLRKCLEKDPSRRLRDIGDARIDIEDVIAESGPMGRSLGMNPAGAPSVGGARFGLAGLSGGGFGGATSSTGARGDTGSGSSGFGVGGKVPAMLTPFIGREVELAEIGDLLPRTRLLTVAGAGGCGKTRLVLETVHRYRSSFEAGAWWVDIASGKDPGVLVPHIAGSLGLTTSDGSDGIAAIADAVQSRELLLVLDGCEFLREPAAEVACRLLELCPGITVLATSREPLGVPGEVVFRAPVMAAPPDDADADDIEAVERCEAVRLFVDRAQAVRSGFRLDASTCKSVAEICRRLDGIPLAIELAAARAKVLSPDQIAERLENRFRLLGGGRRGANTKQGTLEAAIAWSYDQLEPDEQAAFRRLAVCQGGIALSAAEALCVGPVTTPGDGVAGNNGSGEDEILEDEVLDLLSNLVDKSMVHLDEAAEPRTGPAAEPRYLVLETIREYALRELVAAGEESTARDAHLAWVAETVRGGEPFLQGRLEAQWMRRLETEHGNIRGAIRWVLDRGGDLDTGRAIAGAVWRFWVLRGHIPEGRRLLVTLEHRSAGGAPTLAWARVREGISWIAMTVGDLPAAVMFGRAALELAQSLDDKGTVASTLNCLGAACHGEGIDERAVDYLEEALALRKDLGEPVLIADTLSRLGGCLRGLGRQAEAVSMLQHALSMLEHEGDTLVRAQTLTRLSWVRLRLGDRDGASVAAREALRVKIRLSAETEFPESIELAACLAVENEDDERAARLFGGASAVRKRLASPARPATVRDYVPSLETLRSRFPVEREEAARAEGSAMKTRRAVRYALEEDDALLSANP